jgi:cob(I)alamin adenosyltransferase
MGHRLTRIYTRTGDAGTTGLADGTRLRKDSDRIALLGDLDELNSHLGMLLTCAPPPELAACLSEIQQLLFDLGGDLSIPGRTSVSADHVEWLEKWLDHYNDTLPPLKEFILPGGNAAAAQGHLARSVSRRAERRAVALSQSEDPGLNTLAFLNRLSDFLFVACRILARMNGKDEVFWQVSRNPPLEPPN